MLNDASEFYAAQQRADALIKVGAVSVAEALTLEKALTHRRAFQKARRLLDLSRADPRLAVELPLRIELAQRRALCTYKDPNLAEAQRLAAALDILRQGHAGDDLATTRNQESLGLAGAILKRQWQASGQKQRLEQSLTYYMRGYRQGISGDGGYTAVNAAFVLDSLADIETAVDDQVGADDGGGAARRREQARAIRREIVQALSAMQPQTWWLMTTLGSACFGLRDYGAAKLWFERAAELGNAADWQVEATARQLAAQWRIARNEQDRGGPLVDNAAEGALVSLLVKPVAATDAPGLSAHAAQKRSAIEAMNSVMRGKVGLGMSGGGFRASLYHIGVLARLAELDLLRHVEYLSCVSGGSIIGAHYYLEVRHLLQTKAEAEISRQDYVDIVSRIERDFVAGVGRNIRVRLAASWLTNLKMIFESDFSKTQRIGDLYESEIFARIKDGGGDARRWLNKLTIQPLGEADGFSPKDGNWRRSAKVPILVLNATTLNTGHNWQFTATWMGESPTRINTDVDANYRLRRAYYDQLGPERGQVRLGHAVAASACVPGLFDPLALPDLYLRPVAGADKPVKPVVRLVDGGVHDNQGVAALLEQDCKVLLVSDASGQMADADDPERGMLGVPLRANSILQARIRVSEYEDLCSRVSGQLLSGLMFVHLKQGLGGGPVDWVDCQDPSPPQPSDDDEPTTSYGVRRPVQRLLAALRTDLDSFTEVEACALMASGYQMTKHALEGDDDVLGFRVDPQPTLAWGFLKILPLMQQSPPPLALTRQLKVGSLQFMKVWQLDRPLKIASRILLVVALALAAFWALSHLNDVVFSLSVVDILLAAIVAGVSLFTLPWVARLINFRKSMSEVLVGIGMATVGFLLARLHLLVFDRVFLRQGRLARLLANARSR